MHIRLLQSSIQDRKRIISNMSAAMRCDSITLFSIVNIQIMEYRSTMKCLALVWEGVVTSPHRNAVFGVLGVRIVTQ